MYYSPGDQYLAKSKEMRYASVMKAGILLLVLFISLVALAVFQPQLKKELNQQANRDFVGTIELFLPVSRSEVRSLTKGYLEGETLLDTLDRVTQEEKIFFGRRENDDGTLDIYKVGDVGLITKDCEMNVLVNSVELRVRVDQYFPQNGDQIELVYFCK